MAPPLSTPMAIENMKCDYCHKLAVGKYTYSNKVTGVRYHLRCADNARTGTPEDTHPHEAAENPGTSCPPFNSSGNGNTATILAMKEQEIADLKQRVAAAEQSFDMKSDCLHTQYMQEMEKVKTDCQATILQMEIDHKKELAAVQNTLETERGKWKESTKLASENRTKFEKEIDSLKCNVRNLCAKWQAEREQLEKEKSVAEDRCRETMSQLEEQKRELEQARRHKERETPVKGEHEGNNNNETTRLADVSCTSCGGMSMNESRMEQEDIGWCSKDLAVLDGGRAKFEHDFSLLHKSISSLLLQTASAKDQTVVMSNLDKVRELSSLANKVRDGLVGSFDQYRSQMTTAIGPAISSPENQGNGETPMIVQ